MIKNNFYLVFMNIKIMNNAFKSKGVNYMKALNLTSKYLIHFLKPFLIFVFVGVVLGRNMFEVGNIAMALIMSIGIGVFVPIKENGW